MNGVTSVWRNRHQTENLMTTTTCLYSVLIYSPPHLPCMLWDWYLSLCFTTPFCTLLHTPFAPFLYIHTTYTFCTRFATHTPFYIFLSSLFFFYFPLLFFFLFFFILVWIQVWFGLVSGWWPGSRFLCSIVQLALPCPIVVLPHMPAYLSFPSPLLPFSPHPQDRHHSWLWAWLSLHTCLTSCRACTL